MTSRVAVVLLSASIVVVSSEKFYWYPQGIGWEFAELAAAYAFPVMAAFWVIDRYAVGLGWRAVIASAIFALGVEGVVTPVLYEDGPVPALALYFFAWHGVLSFVFCWYLVRKWALAKQPRRLGLWSLLYGIAWGAWSSSYWRAESIAEMQAENAAGDANWDPGQWAISKFALYAAAVTAVLIVCHWLLGFVWQSEWSITRRWTAIVGLLLALQLVVVTAAVPWAPLKLGALVGMVVWWLRRTERESISGYSIFNQLVGRVQPLQLAPLALLAAGATASYAMLSLADPSPEALDAVYWGTVIAQVAAGFFVAVTAVQNTRL